MFGDDDGYRRDQVDRFLDYQDLQYQQYVQDQAGSGSTSPLKMLLGGLVAVICVISVDVGDWRAWVIGPVLWVAALVVVLRTRP